MNIKDSIDLELWKQLQDKFAESIDLPVSTVDKEGNELVVSNKRPLFCEMIRKKRSDLCIACTAKRLKEIEKEGKSIKFYCCHAGLLNIMVPLFVEENLVGAVVCESIKRQNSVALCQRLGKEIGVEPIKLIDAQKKIKSQKREDTVSYGTLLHTLSKTIPKVVHEKYKDEKKISELQVLQKISQTLNSGLELQPIINYILEFFEKNIAKSSIILLNENKKTKYRLPGSTTSQLAEDEANSLSQVLAEKTWMLKKKDDNYHLCVPLKVKNTIIGAINLVSSENISNSIEFISIIADQTALAVTNAVQYEEIKKLAITDKLTNVFNRRELMNRIDAEITRSKRFHNPLSLIMLDADDFSEYNNAFGHPEGDSLLTAIADAMKSCVRDIDTIGRYGGEEFTIILPETDIDNAKAAAERIREKIESIQAKRKITASIGVAAFLDPEMEKDQMIKIVDEALYEAKNSGKNKVAARKIVSDKLKVVESLPK